MRSDSSLSFHQPLTLSQISLGETGQLQYVIQYLHSKRFLSGNNLELGLNKKVVNV